MGPTFHFIDGRLSSQRMIEEDEISVLLKFWCYYYYY